MKNRSVNISGLLLILVGGLALLDATLGPLLGWEFSIWRLWPLLIATTGAGLLVAPFFFWRQQGLKHLFIPGFPIFITSVLLLLSSVFDIWGIWARFWPLVVLGLGVGFFVTAVLLSNLWLMIPAIIIGVNGLLFQFCALTGLWELWAIFWTFEPLAVGLALIIASAGRNRGLIRAGLIVGLVGAGLLSMMSFLLSGWVSMVGAALLILVGAGLITNGRKQTVFQEKAPKEKLADGY